MRPFRFSKELCKDALNRLEGSETAHLIFNELIDKYFEMVDHMKRTSIWDILLYEKDVLRETNGWLEDIIVQNNELKKEVNELRKKLEMTKKYRIIGE